MFGLQFDNYPFYKTDSIVRQGWRILYVDKYFQSPESVLYVFFLLDELPVLLYKYISIFVHCIVKDVELRFYNVYVLNLTYDYLGQFVNLVDKFS